MKSEMIVFTPSGLIALIVAVVMICIAVTGAWPFLLVAASLLAFVREDVRESFKPGIWTRRWFVWTWQGPAQ